MGLMGFVAKDVQGDSLQHAYDSSQGPVVEYTNTSSPDLPDQPDSNQPDQADLDLAVDILQPAMTPLARSMSRDRGREPSYNTPSAPFPPLQSPEPEQWVSGQHNNKRFTIADPSRLKSSMAAAIQTRHQRAQSAGESALKRLSKALPSLPSITIPSNLLPALHAPNPFSSTSSSPQKDGSRSSRQNRFSALSPFSSRFLGNSAAPNDDGSRLAQPDTATAMDRVPSRPQTLRSVASDDSVLYHSLSRMSSLGDDARFSHVREQVNVRIKAIMDSFDGPSFKLPQMPSLLNVPLKKTAADPTPEPSRSSTAQSSARADKDPLDEVLETLTGDVVIMGGYRGSILRSAKPPHRRLWVPVKVQLGVRKVNLEVGLDPEDEEHMEETIIPDGMLKNIGPVDISRRLFKRLRECENARAGKLRVHDYGYDWRLSPHLLSRKLVEFLEKLPCNQPGVPPAQRGALVIAHSLGGLITRHAVNQRPELFSGVVYVGVPQQCISILGPLRNGDVVALNDKLLTAQVNFSMRTSFVFLPEDGRCFVDKRTGEEYRVDFYDPENWVRYRLSPCVAEPPLLTRSGTFSSLLSLSDSLPSLPLASRGRSNTHPSKKHSSASTTSTRTTTRKQQLLSKTPPTTTSVNTPIVKDPELTPRLETTNNTTTTTSRTWPSYSSSSSSPTPSSPSTRARNLAYLTRVLAETKRFRAQLAHDPALQSANRYPPFAVMYGKDMPTCCGARLVVAGRQRGAASSSSLSRGATGTTAAAAAAVEEVVEAIARADAYDNLMFASGDGVVLAKDAMLPQGYEVVKGGRVRTDRGHVGMLGDLDGVGRAVRAVVRGRRKGIGLGIGGGEEGGGCGGAGAGSGDGKKAEEGVMDGR